MTRIDVAHRADLTDPEGVRFCRALGEAGLLIEGVRTYRAYLFEKSLSSETADGLARQLLVDPVLEVYAVGEPLPAPKGFSHRVEIARQAGVMDPVEGSLRRAAKELGIDLAGVKCMRGAWLSTSASPQVIQRAVEKALANPIVDQVQVDEPLAEAVWRFPAQSQARVEIPIRDLSAVALADLSRGRGWGLADSEMRAIQDHYRQVGREPTDVELETFAQTWSEHCSHKTFRGRIVCEGGTGAKTIDNLLKSTIARATQELARDFCVSVFEDNAGVIRLDDRWGLAFKVETHNHPSAIEPYGGAGTGIGGVIRDILGCGLGAKPILNLDVFCVGPLDADPARLPLGVLHPRRVLGGVVAGVRDYGNRMGIPTAAGAVSVHPGYIANPLVFCGTLGLIPLSAVVKRARPGDLVVVMGGRTGRDGIHGATFSSETLTAQSETASFGAVQIGDPITEKRAMDALLLARDRGLFTCVTDCGAGGLSSAVGEMAKDLGAEVDLDKVPLKYAGLTYREIWISESQERMVLAVPPAHWPTFQALCVAEETEAAAIGRFTGNNRLVLRFSGTVVAEMDLAFLHDGCPRPTLAASSRPEPDVPKERSPTGVAPGEALRKILAAVDVASKEWIVRQYDHEVQGMSAGKPLVGPFHDGPGDAAVLTPLRGQTLGAAVGLGLKVHYGMLDPYRMAASAIDEALRNVVAVGGDPARTAILDNFCWGDTRDPHQLHALTRAAEACYDIAKAFGTPFISGKDSLHNTYEVDGKRASIPPTLLVSALSVIPDVRHVTSMDFKRAGDAVYLVGLTRRELGGSLYHVLCGGAGGIVPAVDAEGSRRTFAALFEAIRAGCAAACHDLSEGGLGVALAEMAFAGNLGANINLGDVAVGADVAAAAEILFSESNGRFLVEVPPGKEGAFQMLMGLAKVPCQRIGRTQKEPVLRCRGEAGGIILEEPLSELKRVWQEVLPRAMEGPPPDEA